MCHIGKKRMKLFLFFIFLKNMKDAILVIGGSFNPVHTQHISMLCLAKQELENTGESLVDVRQWRKYQLAKVLLAKSG